jgi:hypothetical protein
VAELDNTLSRSETLDRSKSLDSNSLNALVESMSHTLASSERAQEAIRECLAAHGLLRYENGLYLARASVLTIILASLGSQMDPYIREANVDKVHQICDDLGVDYARVESFLDVYTCLSRAIDER